MGTPNNTQFPWLGGDPTSTYPKDWQLTIGGVKCAVYHAEGDAIIEYNLESGRGARVQFICNWNERIDFMAGLLGTVDYVDGQIIRQNPWAYPVSLPDTELTFPRRTICTEISSVRGIHWWTDNEEDNTDLADEPVPHWGGYVYAIVTAEFTTPPYLIEHPPDDYPVAFNDLLDQTYCITRIKAGGEVLVPPLGSFVWAGGPEAGAPVLIGGAPHMRTRSEISCTRVRMPIYPVNAIQAAIGSVNDKSIIIAGYEYKRGSILFNNVVPELRSDPLESGIIMDLEMIFLANSPAGTGQIAGSDNLDPLDWNYFLNTQGQWQPIYTSGSNKPPFRYVDWGPGGLTCDLFSNTIS